MMHIMYFKNDNTANIVMYSILNVII